MTGVRLLGLRGTVRLRVTGACPEDILTGLAAAGVRFRDYRREDDLTACLTVPGEALREARRIGTKTMCQIEVVETSGMLPTLQAMGWRLLLPVWLGLLTVFVFWLQGHTLFFRVSGNTTIPDQVILETLESCGVGFFTPMDSIDLNLLKNRMLSQLPNLRFVTVNTHGGVAEVIVREREEKPVISGSAAPANILAAKDGLITSVTVTGGTPEVRPGDLVTKGEVLVSGVTNLDKTVMVTRAEGEVYARTWNPVEAVLPEEMTYKQATGRETRVFAVTFGKKQINFYKTSGISYGNYDKMTTVKPLTLPGGYTLPVSLTVTVFREYTQRAQPMESESAEALLEMCVREQLLGGMTAGSIQGMRMRLRQQPGYYRMTGTAECQEEIGVVAEIKD